MLSNYFLTTVEQGHGEQTTGTDANPKEQDGITNETFNPLVHRYLTLSA
jgi:hypothetical protein